MDADPNVRIRKAVPSDAAAFETFMLSAWREAGPDAPGFTGASEEVIADLATPETFTASVAGPVRAMLLARIAGHVVGFVATRWVDESTAEITGLIVHPCNAGQGIGTALVERAIGALDPRLLESVVARTEVDIHRAIAFYERLGFRPSGPTTEDVAGDAVELCELVMSV